MSIMGKKFQLITDNDTVSQESSFDLSKFELEYDPNLNNDGFSFRNNISIAIDAFAIVSQVIVLLIAKGLPGNFSASTFLMAQAAAEMWRRLNMIHQPLCFVIGDVIFAVPFLVSFRFAKKAFTFRRGAMFSRLGSNRLCSGNTRQTVV